MATDPSIQSILKHSITVVVPVHNTSNSVLGNEYGEPVQGDAEDELIPCFIEMKKRRFMDSNHRIIIYNATVTFGADANVSEDWKVKDGVDVEGNTILRSGRIVEVNIIEHPEEGILAKIASVEIL